MPNDLIRQRWLKEGQFGGLGFGVNSAEHIFNFKVTRVEPADYKFTYDDVLAGKTANFLDLVDDSSTFILDPVEDTIINHFFWGISPSRCEVYLQYPKDVDRGSLAGTRALGSGNGMIDGNQSSYLCPSIRTETVSIKDVRPAYGLFNPSLETISPAQMLYVMKYRVDWMAAKELTEQQLARRRIIAVGGIGLIDAPAWLQTWAKGSGDLK